jgi:hypothetical protein
MHERISDTIYPFLLEYDLDNYYCLLIIKNKNHFKRVTEWL